MSEKNTGWYVGWCRETQKDELGNTCVWNVGGGMYPSKGAALAYAASCGQTDLKAGCCDDFEVYAEEVPT